MTVGALARYSLSVLLIAAALMAGLAIGRGGTAAGRAVRSPPTGPQREQPPLVEASRPTVEYMRGDKPAWRAKLERVELSAGGKAVATGPLEEAVVYDRNGRAVIRVVARGVRGSAATRDFVIDGPVKAVAERGAILSASQVQWLDEEARLHCVGPVTVRFRNALVTAPQADLFVEKDLVVVPSEVRMTVGNNLVVGRSLTYNIATDSFHLRQVRIVLHAEEAKQQLRELRR